MSKKKIVVFGSNEFTVEVLKTLFETNCYDLFAWTGRDRNNPIAKYALQNNIPLFQPQENQKEKDRIPELEKISPDLCITMAYGKIIPQAMIDVPQLGFINIHVSLLPDLRGATPIQTALLKGYTKSGITIQQMVYQMDAGDILARYEINIDINDNAETLRRKMYELTCPDLDLFLNKYFAGEIKTVPQDETKATFCMISDFTREAGKIDWQDNALNIHNKIRAFYPEPVAWCLYNQKILNIRSSLITETKSQNKPGEMFFVDKKLYIATQDFDLEILELVLEGKKKMLGLEFGNGTVQKQVINLL